MRPAMHPRAQALIELLDLRPHPEGGYYREIFRSTHTVRRGEPAHTRAALTTIYFLLAAGQASRWHRVASDEVWHFYEGDPLELLWLDEDGATCRRSRLGPVGDGIRPVETVPAGCWQAAHPAGAYALVGCSVGPGFDFADFALLADDADGAAAMRRRFPELARLV